MKPFNLEEAKAGKPVCTRDGHSVRIICFDRVVDGIPIVALITTDDSTETVVYYDENGIAHGMLGAKLPLNFPLNLMMKPEKKQGWFAIYRSCSNKHVAATTHIYATKEEVENIIKENAVEDEIIEIRKIEWEK